jgi:hypothetical protein
VAAKRNTPTPYNFSFTAASLRPELARIVAECYREAGNWAAAREQILATNALQARRARSAARLESELRQRLTELTEEQLTLLTSAPAEDRAALAWLAAMKRSRFHFDYAAEVLRDMLAVHEPLLRPSDYERFTEAKSAAHPELARLSNSSRAKVREVLLHMLREAGLLGGRARRGGALGTIMRPVLSPAVLHSIREDDPHWLAGFLVPHPEIDTI